MHQRLQQKQPLKTTHVQPTSNRAKTEETLTETTTELVWKHKTRTTRETSLTLTVYSVSAQKISCVVKHMKDPKINLDNKNKPKYLTEEESKSSMNNMIQDQEVNQYVYKKEDLKNNLKKKFAII